MPPEHEAPVRAFYDHEEDEPRSTRRRRAVADWGVSEDVFDRMPGPRFSRRGEAPREVTRRREPARSEDAGYEGSRDAARDAGYEAGERRRDDARLARDAEYEAGERRRDDARFARDAGCERRRDDARFARADDTSAAHDGDARDDDPPRQPKERVADDWFAEPGPVSRTIVIEREPAADDEPEPEARIASHGRRTVVIGGHPERLPARVRTPRTSVTRIGPKPDRIVAYAVALGVLLILIAILSSH